MSRQLAEVALALFLLGRFFDLPFVALGFRLLRMAIRHLMSFLSTPPTLAFKIGLAAGAAHEVDVRRPPMTFSFDLNL